MKKQINPWRIIAVVYTTATTLTLLCGYYVVADAIFERISSTSNSTDVGLEGFVFLVLVIYALPYAGSCYAIFKLQEFFAIKAGFVKFARQTKYYYIASGLLFVLTCSSLFF